MLLAAQRRPTLNIPNVKSSASIMASSGPPSPTMSTNSIISSMSWIVEKSPTDLIPMLKNAYTALKDKERGRLFFGYHSGNLSNLPYISHG